MYLLGRKITPDEVKQMMIEPLRGEMAG
jgi:hypothetical protein